MIVREYLNSPNRHPEPQDGYNSILACQRWFDPQFLEQACEVMEKNDVALYYRLVRNLII